MTEPQATDPPPDPHTEDGVDMSLVHWLLSMTPLERLRTLQNTLNSLERLRELNDPDKL